MKILNNINYMRLSERQYSELRNRQHNRCNGYDFEFERGVIYIRSSTSDGRKTEPKHRAAIHAAEIKEGVSQEYPYHLFLANLEEKTLEQDHDAIRIVAEDVSRIK